MIRTVTAGAAVMAVVLGLGGCSKKAPGCDERDVLAYLQQDDGIMKDYIDKRYDFSKIVDGGMDGNLRRCSAVLTTTVTLKEDLPVITEKAKKASEGKGITEQLTVGTYLMSLAILGLKKKGDTHSDESELTYTTTYTTKGEPVTNIVDVR